MDPSAFATYFGDELCWRPIGKNKKRCVGFVRGDDLRYRPLVRNGSRCPTWADLVVGHPLEDRAAV